MNESTASRIEEIRLLSLKSLRAKYRELFGHEPPRYVHRGALGRRVRWQLQALEQGGLSEETKRRLDELARDPALNVFPNPSMAPAATEPTAGEKRSFRFRRSSNPRLPLPGSVIVKSYRGRELRVTVLPNSFEFEGQMFASLSAVAKHVTQSHLSGMAFFGLAKRRGEAKKKGGTTT